jgi:hypothetical protein
MSSFLCLHGTFISPLLGILELELIALWIFRFSECEAEYYKSVQDSIKPQLQQQLKDGIFSEIDCLMPFKGARLKKSNNAAVLTGLLRLRQVL